MTMPADDDTTVRPDAYVVAIGAETQVPAHVLARDLRHAGLSVLLDYEPRSPRSQMKRADRTGAAYVLIVGSDELARGEISVKTMATGEQETVSRDQIVARLCGTQKDYVKT